MKKTIIILLIAISFNCNAQYSNKKMNTFKDLVIPITIMTATFTTVECMHYSNTSVKTGTITALTGMATTIVSFYIVKGIKNNTPRKIRNRRFKKFKCL